jgi:hypothetical protein
LFNKWYGWKCGLHYWLIVTVPAGQLLERYRYQQLRIQLMKWTKLSALLMELFRLGTIIDNNNAPTVATITPASATEGWCGIRLYLEQPFCSRYYYILF